MKEYEHYSDTAKADFPIVGIGELIKVDSNVKAIVSSGYSSDSFSDYKVYGFCDVIAKPYRLQELGKVLSSVIREGKK